MAAYGGCSTKKCEASLSEEEDTCMSYEEEDTCMSYEDKRYEASLSKTKDKRHLHMLEPVHFPWNR